MRISDDRYTRDRRALDVAVRLIDFEARTGTIRRLTGLADGRIRSLSRTCGVDGSMQRRKRHRGSSPHSVVAIMGKTQIRSEAVTLLGLSQLMGVKEADPLTDRLSDRVAHAERLCDVYWTFRYLLPEATITFEHLLLLLSEVDKAEELVTTHCRSCNALLLVDILSMYGSRCPHCIECTPYRRTEDASQYDCTSDERVACTR